MKKVIQLKTYTGKVIFEYSKENNTIKDTLEEAARQIVNLRNIQLVNADLNGIELKNVDLSGAVFYNVSLMKSNLQYVYLDDSILNDVTFDYSILNSLTLIESSIRDAYFDRTLLYNSILHKTSLFKVSFIHADLKSIDSRYSTFSECNFCSAKLDSIDFLNADFYNNSLSDILLTNVTNLSIPMNLPEGEFIAWKKLGDDTIVKLKILADSKRSRANRNKCRCDKALVLEFQNKNGDKLNTQSVINDNYAFCEYKVGEIVYADSWDKNRFNECSHGIHFFIDRQSAIDY